MVNDVRISGGITKDAKVNTFDSGVTKLAFTVAVPGVKWNKETRQEEVNSSFISVEWWVPGVFAEEHMLYKGDAVLVDGELTQYTSGEQTHTRVLGLRVTVTKRGRDGFAALHGGRPQQQQRPAPAAENVPDF